MLPLVDSEAALLVVFAALGASSFALYTSAITLLGDRYTGSLLIAGTATFSLSYAVGSACGSSVTGAAMEIWSPAAAPVVVGLVVLIMTASFAADRAPPTA